MSQKRKSSRRPRKGILSGILCTILMFTGFLCCFAARWYLFTCGDQSFNAMLFTLFSGISGTDQQILESFILGPLLLALCCTVFLAALFCQRSRFHLIVGFLRHEVTLSPISHGAYCWICAILFLSLLIPAEEAVGLREWISNAKNASTLFDTEYIDPAQTRIAFPQKKRNLIYLYLESMETTFCSKEQGGSMEKCVIPELYALAQENTSFSDSDKIGGWGAITGTTWTTAGMISQSGGIPLLLPFGANSADTTSRPLQNATLLWDILKEEGYYQAVIMGSDPHFSGQEAIFPAHGIDNIFDYNSAMRDGIIPEGYGVFWGMEDSNLYAYARKVLTDISQNSQPFQVCITTIDTHFPDGYICEACKDDYSEPYENVYACASRQAYAFVQWLREQPFYEDTTIVICGDHLSMAGDYLRRNNLEDARRRVYNCILNAAVSTENTNGRAITPFDMFPTTLAAMGCQIEGDRLGLGVNLFSDQPTLAERIGVDSLNEELDRSTIPYLLRFLMQPESGDALRSWLGIA